MEVRGTCNISLKVWPSVLNTNFCGGEKIFQTLNHWVALNWFIRGVVIIVIVVYNFQSVDQDVVQEENITIVEQAMDSAAGMTNLCGIIILSKYYW